MNDIASDRVGLMQNPPHLGELIRENMDDVGWNVTETAARLGCERGTLSRLLNGKAGVSANMALSLEDIGWDTAEHWMRMQASLRACAGASGEDRRRTACGRVARMIEPSRQRGRYAVSDLTAVLHSHCGPTAGRPVRGSERAAWSDAPVVERSSRPRRHLR